MSRMLGFPLGESLAGARVAGSYNADATAVASMTSATYVDMTGTEFVIDKRFNDSKLLFLGYYDWGVTGTQVIRAALSFNGTDYPFAEAPQARIAHCGFLLIEGIPAGQHDAVIRWLRVSGAGAGFRAVTDHWGSCVVLEV